MTALFCLIDDAYFVLNPKGRRYESMKRLSDSEVLTPALLQQLRGVESERSFLRDAGRFFSHLFPGAVGLHPSSLHRRVRRLRRFLGPLRRAVLGELTGDPETLIVDSTLLGEDRVDPPDAAWHPRLDLLREVHDRAAGAGGGEPRDAPRNAAKPEDVTDPRPFVTGYRPHRLGLFGPEDALGEEGWLKALRLEGYAARSRSRPGTPQDALFSYPEAPQEVEPRRRG